MCIARRFYPFVFGLAALGIGGCTCAADATQKFLPAQASLELDGKTFSPVAVRDPWEWENKVGPRRFVVRGDTVEEIGAQSGKAAWSAKSPDGLHLIWRGAAGHEALLQAFNPAAK